MSFHSLKYFKKEKEKKRESISSPFEVVLPHKDIGHPSPSRRWPGQPDHNGDGSDDGDNGGDGGGDGSDDGDNAGDVETGENSVMIT